ncbi:hypothetical protein TDB9533_03550 [Thalassocella blandensis]|nr:hypothetical protein TDB9533_03550 [Thalassocella blandensis]
MSSITSLGQQHLLQNSALNREEGQKAAQYQEKLALSSSQQNANGQTIQVSASVSNTVSISGYSTKSHTFVPNGVEKYQAIQEDKPKTEAANNILNFISAQLARDFAEGASAEELESRLAAGLQGFMQGYSEAAELLSGSGLLTEDIEAAIEQTYNQVLQGIDDLAQKYGVESPLSEDGVPKAEAGAVTTETLSSQGKQPVTSPEQSLAAVMDDFNKPLEDLETLLQATQMDYEGYEGKSFSFDLRTQDGDVVTITASSQQSTSFSASSVNYGDQYAGMNARGVSLEASSSASFNFSVKGELDEGEMQAIGDLLGKIGQISDTFFSGNVMDAFNLATELGFDGEEIAAFSLNLRHETYQKLDNSYGSVQQMQPQEDVQAVDKATRQFQHLARFVQMLEEARLQAEQTGVDKDTIGNVAQTLGEQRNPADERVQQMGAFLNDMLGHLENYQKVAV